MNRFTTDNPQSNLETMLNYAYAKDDKSVYLRYGNGEENIELFKYLASIAKKDLHCNGCQEQTLKDDVNLDCDCIISVLYTVAGQAAELRERLKRYEDKIEQGKIIELPCKVGDEIYEICERRKNGEWRKVIVKRVINSFEYGAAGVGIIHCGSTISVFTSDLNKTVFLTKEAAEQALRTQNNENTFKG